jgi:hypothetical protein
LARTASVIGVGVLIGDEAFLGDGPSIAWLGLNTDISLGVDELTANGDETLVSFACEALNALDGRFQCVKLQPL